MKRFRSLTVNGKSNIRVPEARLGLDEFPKILNRI